MRLWALEECVARACAKRAAYRARNPPPVTPVNPCHRFQKIGLEPLISVIISNVRVVGA